MQSAHIEPSGDNCANTPAAAMGRLHTEGVVPAQSKLSNSG
jgi:hypothetical protein